MNHTFKAFKLSAAINKAIELLGYSNPTPVQQKVIPLMLMGGDLIAKAKTGSGKTAAFVIPSCEQMDWEENKPQVLILAPTRELAEQIKETCFNLGRFKRLKCVALYGKAPFSIQAKALKQKTHFVIGTPGRVLDHLERGTLELGQVKQVIIDEADEMLKMGFMEQMKAILSRVPQKRQTLLFSATLPKAIEQMAQEYLNEPTYVEIDSPKTEEGILLEEAYKVKTEEKLEALKWFLAKEQPQSAIVFCNTRQMVNEVEAALLKEGFPVMKLHGELEQRERFQVLETFTQGKRRLLIATDVAARGIDVSHVSHVFNWELPEKPEQYVHRVGRTARAGRQGKAISFISQEEYSYWEAIKAYRNKEVVLASLPELQLEAGSFQAAKEDLSKSIQVENQFQKVNEGIMKLHINAGRKTKMRPVDIVGTLCNLEGMSAEDIGIIQIEDISTFVEILNGKGEQVYKLLQNTPIKGRLRKVSKKDIT